MKNKYSPSCNTFFPAELMERYTKAGTLPNDLVDVNEYTFIIFIGEAPEGKVRNPGADGYPCWKNI